MCVIWVCKSRRKLEAKAWKCLIRDLSGQNAWCKHILRSWRHRRSKGKTYSGFHYLSLWISSKSRNKAFLSKHPLASSRRDSNHIVRHKERHKRGIWRSFAIVVTKAEGWGRKSHFLANNCRTKSCWKSCRKRSYKTNRAYKWDG